ncbi:conserved Plasmodium protein, unknown function [Plasmodium relictum]|uniref:Uncharacterized protein n=1 Tax=Plasmodium relictum TaxID=85471 RepID=A0A1J1H4D0_PLARL|nr:conserved Plasmodium protein, unknown function [Plasmodium relictum]CRG99545.1 conserved Plasmodium protein, unknown function [Plasmodium relictum]
MNERFIINNILIKNLIVKRYIKCLYKNKNNENNIITFLYKYSKYYKKLGKVDIYKSSEKKLYIAYTSDRNVKIKNIKNRILRHKITYNFSILFFILLFLIILYSLLTLLVLYNNNNHVECVIPFNDCPIILHSDINNFFKNYKINELTKDNILLFYRNIKKLKPENIKKIHLKKKKTYKILKTEKIKCNDCEVFFNITENETIQDILDFEEINKCAKVIDQSYCLNVRNNKIENKRIHLYKKYTGHIKDTNYFQSLKKYKQVLNDLYYNSYMKEKVVIRNRIKYLYPLLRDYFVNLDDFKLYNENNEKIIVNDENIRNFEFLKDKDFNICRSSYKKKYSKSTFYWLCPEFYKKKKHLHEYKVSKIIEQVLNFKNVGYAHKNKHIIEMSKSNPTRNTYNHFGYISNSLSFPFKLDIYNRFKILEEELLVNEVIEQVYKAFFCPYNKNVEKNSEIKNKMHIKNAVLHKDVDILKLAFFSGNYPNGIIEEKIEKNIDEEKKDEYMYEKEYIEKEDKKDEYIYEKKNIEEYKNGSENINEQMDDICEDVGYAGEIDDEDDDEENDEVNYGNVIDLYKEDQHNGGKGEKELNHILKLSNKIKLKSNKNLNSIKKKNNKNSNETKNSNYKKENNISKESYKFKKKYVLIEEVAKVNENLNYKTSRYKFTKELVIISSSIFHGNMKNLLKTIILFLCILVLMNLILVTFYIYIKGNKEISIVLKDDEEIEEMPKYIKRLSKHLSNDKENIKKNYFRNYKHSSSPF